MPSISSAKRALTAAKNGWVITIITAHTNILQALLQTLAWLLNTLGIFQKAARILQLLVLALVRVFSQNKVHLINLNNIIVYADRDDFEKFMQANDGNNGESYKQAESHIVLMNHRHHADFIYVMLYSASLNLDLMQKVFLKKSLLYTPVGPMNYFNDSCFLSRSFEKDKNTINKYCQKLKKNNEDEQFLKLIGNFVFMSFAEGTRMTDKKLAVSNLQGLEKFRLSPLKNLLHAKPTGYYLLQSNLKFTVPTYIVAMKILNDDPTLSPKEAEEVEKKGPSILDILAGNHKGKIHMQIKRFDNLKEELTIPVSANGETPVEGSTSSNCDKVICKKKTTEWLNQQWRILDGDIEHLKNTGKYPEESGIKRIDDFVSDETKQRCARCFFYSQVYTAIVTIISCYYILPSITIRMVIGLVIFLAALVVVAMRLSDPEKSSNKVIDGRKKEK